MSKKTIGTEYVILDSFNGEYIDVILVDFTDRNLFFKRKNDISPLSFNYDYFLDRKTNEFNKIVRSQQGGQDEEFKSKYNRYYHKICSIPENFFWTSISKYFNKATGLTHSKVGVVEFYKQMENFYRILPLPNSPKSVLMTLKNQLKDTRQYFDLCFDARSIYSFNIMKIDEKHDTQFQIIAYELRIVNNLLRKVDEKLRGKTFGNEKWLWDSNVDIIPFDKNKEYYKKEEKNLLKALPIEVQKGIEKNTKEREEYKQNYLQFIGTVRAKSPVRRPSILKTTVVQEGGESNFRDKFHKYYHFICDPTGLFFHDTIKKYFSKQTKKTFQTTEHDQMYNDMYSFYQNLFLPVTQESKLLAAREQLESLLNDLNLCFDERMIYTYSIINNLDTVHRKHYKTLGFRINIANILLKKIQQRLDSRIFGNDKWLWDVDTKQFNKIQEDNSFQGMRTELYNNMPNEVRESIKNQERTRKIFKNSSIELNMPVNEIKLISIDTFKPEPKRIPKSRPSRPSSSESIKSPWKRLSSSSTESLESIFSQEDFPEVPLKK